MSEKNELFQRITGKKEDYEKLCVDIEKGKEEIEELDSGDDDLFYIKDHVLDKNYSSTQRTKWQQWAEDIRRNVIKTIENDEGSNDNAHYDLGIADKLIKMCRYLPVFTCIFKIVFGDQIEMNPSSSASVENEIRKIKIGLLGRNGKNTRVDVTALKFIKYYDGRFRILCDKDTNKC